MDQITIIQKMTPIALSDPTMQADLLAGMRTSILTYNTEYKIINCHPSIEQVFGYDPDSLLGKPVFHIIPQAFREQEKRWLQSMTQGKPVLQQKSARIKKDGQEAAILLSMSLVRNDKGIIIGVSQIFRDISDELKKEQTVNCLSYIVGGSREAIFTQTTDGIITSWNKASEQLFGFTANEVIGQVMPAIIPNDYQQEDKALLQRIVKREAIENHETIRQTKTGKLIPVSLTISPILDHQDQVIGLSTIAHDTTPGKIAEERQARLAAIVESSDDAIISKTLNGIVTSWNYGAEKIFGYSEKEAIGKHISFIIPFDRIEEEDRIIASIRSGQKVNHFHTIRKRKNGTLVTVSLTISPVKDSLGNIIGASKVARDITREEKDHENLRRYASNMQSLNSTAKAISEKLDVEGIMQKVVDATLILVGADVGVFLYNMPDETDVPHIFRMFSNDQEVTINWDLFSDAPPVTASAFSEMAIDPVDNLEDYVKIFRNRSIASLFYQELKMTSYLGIPVYSGDRKITGGLFFGHRQIRKFSSEHVDLVTNMASQAGIALNKALLFYKVNELNKKKDEFIAMATHELKTPMTTLSGFLQLMKTRVETDPVNASLLEKALKQLNKLGLLLNDLFDVSKIQAGKLRLQFERTDLAELTNEIIEGYKQNKNCPIHLEAPESLPVKVDRLRLEQVIINFIDNAIKYSRNEAMIQVIIEDLGTEASLSVKDQGIGINTEDLQGIFTQFYRAEKVSKKISGLGLGLYISKEIIERHKGKVKVESAEGQGSTFTFTIPKNNS